MKDSFSWVLEETLAGLARPGRNRCLKLDTAFLKQMRVTLLVSLTEEQPDAAMLNEAGIQTVHLPVRDFHAPTLDQLCSFHEIAHAEIGAGGRVGVHCMAGLGRTGTFLASYLIAEGMSAAMAIQLIRQKRPGSIETKEQEQILFQYERYGRRKTEKNRIISPHL